MDEQTVTVQADQQAWTAERYEKLSDRIFAASLMEKTYGKFLRNDEVTQNYRAIHGVSW